jgi:citrate synthase
MAEQSMVVSQGLENVIVAETRLAEVDGERGRLLIRGRDLESVAGRLSFEEVCDLLWEGESSVDPSTTRGDLGAARSAAFEMLPELGRALEARDGMDALRAALAHLAADPQDSPAAQRTRITAAVAVFLAAWARGSRGEPAVEPDPSQGHAEDLLRMIDGTAAAPARTRALDSYLSTVAEHGMCASTFAARVVASTDSDRVSAVVAAIGALKGPLHGGAPGPVLDMLDSIGEPGEATAWLEREIAGGRRIMGMGHRVYRVRDPRASVLERATLELEQAGISNRRLELARAVEASARAVLRLRYPERALEANVEFYTAVLLDSVGLDRSLFTPMFAAARTAGWLAHFDEQRETGRLIRPRARYVGVRPKAA